jgi:hypothetical protein
MKERMKEFLKASPCLIFLFFLGVIFLLRGNEKIEIEFGNSDKFNEKEITAAATHVIDNFLTDGILTKIWYDESQSDSLIELYLEYKDNSDNKLTTENIIAVFTNFIATSDTEIYTPDGIYYNYAWILIRDNNNTWEIDSHGFRHFLRLY